MPHFHGMPQRQQATPTDLGFRKSVCLQGTLTGQAYSVQQFRSHLGRSGCRHTLGSADLGALIWRSLQRRSKLARGPAQATACWRGGPHRGPCWLRSILGRYGTGLPWHSQAAVAWQVHSTSCKCNTLPCIDRHLIKAECRTRALQVWCVTAHASTELLDICKAHQSLCVC